jgi:hypothetical protein
MPLTNQAEVEVVALRQLLPAQQALCGMASLLARGSFRRLTLRSATEFSQRENFHLGGTLAAASK